MAKNNNGVSSWTGWVYFAGFLMIMLGAFQAMAGLTALLRKEYLVVTEEALLAMDFATWGWIHLLIALVIFIAGLSILRGEVWARVVGVIFSGLVVVAHLAYLNVYPIWSLLTIAVGFIVIYSLTVHGGELKNI